MAIMDLFNPEKKLGFGAMRLPGATEKNIDYDLTSKMIDLYLERGFNYFDTAHVYAGSEDALRRCLTSRHPRDSYILVDKLPAWNAKSREDYEALFNTSLERCGVDYFDILLMHNMGSPTYPKAKAAGGFELIAEKKAQGKAKYIGFSFHDSAEYLDMILTEHPEVDVVQLQINYSDWDSASVQSRECYNVALKHGKPVIVMEPVKGGGLVKLPQHALDVFKELDATASPASFAIRYAASLENVAMVLSGMSDLAQVEDNTTFMSEFKRLSVGEYAAVEKVCNILKESQEIPCTNCQYCVEGCPADIPIPRVFSVYNAFKQHGPVNFPTMMFERATLGHGKPSDCIGCGECEEHCPQHLPIRKHLETVGERFDGRPAIPGKA